jgi:hypothetical protein
VFSNTNSLRDRQDKWPKAFFTASEEFVSVLIVFADDQPVNVMQLGS